MQTVFPELISPVEKALAKLHLGWGWKNNEIVLMDLEKLGCRNFPLVIRLCLDMVELRTPLQHDPPEEDLNRAFHSQWRSDSPVFPVYPTEEGGRELGLAVRIPLPEDKKMRRPSSIASLLGLSIVEIALARDKFLAEKDMQTQDADENTEDE